MIIKLKVMALTLLLFPLLIIRPVTAETVDEILAKVDANLTKVTDQTYKSEIKVFRNGNVTKTLEFTVKVKGLQKKLVRFTAPGDVRGMTILTTAEGLMYVYLPSYQRVRRVASHVRNQGFMGTDLSAEDMSAAALSVGWKGSINSEDTDKWVLKLVPKEDNETVHSKLIVTVLKKYGGVSKIDYYSAQGKLVKTQIRSKWETYGPITVPTLFEISDHTTGSKTEMRFNDCSVNTNIPDSAFTKRAILRDN
jgi:outer membrane lipoprotein-sorting protein